MLLDYNNIIYPGMPEIEVFMSDNPSEYFIMNWGGNGQFDEGRYSILVSPYVDWNGFNFNKTVCFNISAGDLYQ